MERSQVVFRRLFEEHRGSVHGYCLRRTNPDDALNAAAEVLLVAWRRMEIVPDGEETLPWLYGVARRVLSRQWRANRRLRRLWSRSRALADPPPDDPESVVVQREEFAQVVQALGRLRDRDQEVLRLAAWDELPHATIADVLGCSVDAVDQRIHRAKRRLARQYRALAHRGHPVGAAARPTRQGGAA